MRFVEKQWAFDMRKPPKIKFKEWAKDDVTQYFLGRLAFHLNEIDTVRNITLENIDETLARKMAIEIIENALADVYLEGELHKFQKKVSEEEDNILKRLREMKQEY